ncbi:hypothetical protein [Sediminibacillus halophilus]|uniref:hypothetical protein n=1 Tax=Sediminibacillus halophilus TaxID=482461 RepID=UPI000941CCB3|nr:hypothetical protein [Sediminibacillus halophilus]
MSQDFIGFLKDKLYSWKKVFDKYQNIPASGFSDHHVPIIVLSTSSLSVAEVLHSELLLDTYPFTIWICVEEDMWEDGLETAFYRPLKDKLQRMRLDFLSRNESTED